MDAIHPPRWQTVLEASVPGALAFLQTNSCLCLQGFWDSVPERKESLAGKRGDRLTLPKACWELPSVSAGEVARVCLQDEALFGGGFQGPQ